MRVLLASALAISALRSSAENTAASSGARQARTSPGCVKRPALGPDHESDGRKQLIQRPRQVSGALVLITASSDHRRRASAGKACNKLAVECCPLDVALASPSAGTQTSPSDRRR